MIVLNTVTAVFLLLAVVEAADIWPRVIIVPPHSETENAIVESFRDDGFEEGTMDEVGNDSYPFRFTYRLEDGRDSMLESYLIIPEHTYINGSKEYFQEGRDFQAYRTMETVLILSKRVGFYHLSVTVLKYGSCATTQSNTVLNAGMSSGCDNVCDPNKAKCETNSCKYLPRDNIECPPNNDCNIISHDASMYNISGKPHAQPIGNAVVVGTCDEFTDAVCEKFNETGGKVDVYVDAHGNNGFFVIGMYDGAKEFVSKGSDCYNKICMKLKDKIKTLTLFSCSTAGGMDGPIFLQCLANCLNANVKAWKQTLYVRAAWNTTNVSSIVWSTARNFVTPSEATPSPSPTKTPSVGTPTPTPTTAPTPTTEEPTTASTTKGSAGSTKGSAGTTKGYK